MKNRTQAKSWFWLAYFVASIAGVGGLIGYCLSAPLFALGRWFPKAGRWGDRVLCWGIGILMAVQPWLRARIDLAELERLDGPVLLVSNHRSHLDAFLLLSRVRGIRILARRSLFRIPFLGMMMRLSRQIPTERGSLESFVNAMEIMRKRIREGDRVHVFPEMTRCDPDFRGTQKFQLAPFHLAIQEGVAVLPIVFRGTDQAWPKGRARVAFRTPVECRALPAIDASRFTSAEALRDAVRTHIDQELSPSAAGST